MVGIVLAGLLQASLKTNSSVIGTFPFVVVAYSHRLLIDVILKGFTVRWGGIDVWLLVTYVVVGIAAAVASEKINPPPSSPARWLRALIVWLVALAGLTLVTLALGWLGILTV